MDQRRLGRTALRLSTVGFGAFKIGRNEGIKYPRGYELPDERAAATLLHGVLDMGIDYIDTAPAYGVSEERIGGLLADRRGDFTVSTKVGERFEGGRSSYAFDAASIRRSIERSLGRLQLDALDLVLVHSDGRDVEIQQRTDAVATLQTLRDEGLVRHIGFSGKTVDGAEAALQWADAIMVVYNLEDRSHEPVIARAGDRGIGVIVKKGLASGHLDPRPAIQFVLRNPHVTSLVIGGLNLEHIRANVRAAEETGDGFDPD